MTHDDILHEQLLKKGQNKYSTLKKVRCLAMYYLCCSIGCIHQIKAGSTEARISFFEQL